ncbi:hypothetical protein BWQ96_02676 [Gracilariopsis chorda]|uniref:Uncharacterized protein n=1 Tax=Gracilariopsis chorda TaxID=448386 RepID=A0A2V3IZE6_9FLOR|nr:hypothetical protein BWQ96_02676 [Gracilariopsis chorda]|eukprot:PXF47532.1 hypothetical protein BWQ96_02676 [Gracilariopsis chorda]
MPFLNGHWFTPNSEYYHRCYAGHTPIYRRRIVAPYSADHYASSVGEWFDATRFSEIPVNPVSGYLVGNKRLRESAWEARWGYMRIRIEDGQSVNGVRVEADIPVDMPRVR